LTVRKTSMPAIVTSGAMLVIPDSPTEGDVDSSVYWTILSGIPDPGYPLQVS
jgi:hypothetical protein